MAFPPRRALLGATLLVAAGVSCDTLQARRRANQAAARYKDGDLVAATAGYEEASRLDPSIAAIHLNLGFAYLSRYEAAPRAADAAQNAEGAVRELKRYIALRPDDPRGRQYLIQTFVDSKRYDDAVAFFQPELERDPPSLEAITLLAQIAAKVGRFDDALRWYDRRAALAPRDTDALEGLGVLVWDHLHSHPDLRPADRVMLADRAIAAMKRAAELKSGNAEALSYWNLLLRERAAGLRCEAVDGGEAAGALPDGGAGDGGVHVITCGEQKARDLAEADRLMRQAAELFRARSAAKDAAKGTK